MSNFTITAHMAEDPPAQRIPVRYWPQPGTCLFGYLKFGEPVSDGDLIHYPATFTMSPLNGEQPVYDLRVQEAQR